ncbi:MAG: cupin domain-containing protein [Armatimonadetes bacterium]|nr:cupin domain-containing protein [Armatimonadota bacterium]
MIIRAADSFGWQGIEKLPYKETGTHFKSISRQTLTRAPGDLNVEVRYFEVEAGGHSTLERHQHQHLVMILRGRGRVLIGDQVSEISERDLVHIEPLTWHQFRADQGEPLGFLCLVCNDRDRPQLPADADLEILRSDPAVSEFIRV